MKLKYHIFLITVFLSLTSLTTGATVAVEVASTPDQSQEISPLRTISSHQLSLMRAVYALFALMQSSCPHDQEFLVTGIYDPEMYPSCQEMLNAIEAFLAKNDPAASQKVLELYAQLKQRGGSLPS